MPRERPTRPPTEATATPSRPRRPRSSGVVPTGAREAPGGVGAHGAAPGVERLQRTLARGGVGSRRQAEELIAAGRVTVDGRVATLGDRVDPRRVTVEVDGVPVPTDPELRYLVLNKPVGVTTTMRDRFAGRTVADLLPAGTRVVPVGRLDRDTEGLLLLTNDGTLAHRLSHPRFGVEKEYLAEVQGHPARPALRSLTAGVELEDGTARAIAAGVTTTAGGRAAVRVVMAEGRKREVRRMLQAIGYPVQRLVRVRVGPIRLGRLGPGEIRALDAAEVRELYRVAGLHRAARDRPA